MSGRLRAIAVPVMFAVTLATACSKGSGSASTSPSPRPSTNAELTILSPKNGAIVHGTKVFLKVALQGAKIVRPSTTHIVPTQGHLHVYLNQRLVSMNFGLTQTIGGLKPGLYLLRVEFVASDHLPFDPRDFKETTFQVKT